MSQLERFLIPQGRNLARNDPNSAITFSFGFFVRLFPVSLPDRTNGANRVLSVCSLMFSLVPLHDPKCPGCLCVWDYACFITYCHDRVSNLNAYVVLVVDHLGPSSLCGLFQHSVATPFHVHQLFMFVRRVLGILPYQWVFGVSQWMDGDRS